jgi:hypothetical protein
MTKAQDELYLELMNFVVFEGESSDSTELIKHIETNRFRKRFELAKLGRH